MKDVLVTLLAMLTLTACQSAPPMDPVNMNENVYIARSDTADDYTVAPASVAVSQTVSETSEGELLSGGHRIKQAEKMLLGSELNECQQQLTSLGLYDKRAFNRNKAKLDSNVATIKKYLAIRNTLSTPTAAYFDVKHKGAVDALCAKVQRDVDVAVNRSVPLL